VPQPGSTSLLDPIREVLLNQLTYRNMGTHEVDRRHASPPTRTPAAPAPWSTPACAGSNCASVGAGNWTLFQEGTFSPGDTSTHHLMGTIAMDKFGNMAWLQRHQDHDADQVRHAGLHRPHCGSDAAGVMSLGETKSPPAPPPKPPAAGATTTR
jgi:hypothetical protein